MIFILRSFDSGQQWVPTQTVQLTDLGLAILPPIPILIQSSLSEGQQRINDIEPLMAIKQPLWFWAILLIVLIVVFILTLIVYQKRRKLPQLSEGTRPILLDPRRQARQALQALLQQLSKQSLSVKQGYFELTRIMNQYLTQRLNTNFLDATTREVTTLLNQQKQVYHP